MANAIRFLAMDAVQKANSGHPGMPMGMADVATVLFSRFLKFDPTNPDWPDRDRFVLSNGHGSMLLYAVLHLTGYADISMEELSKFRQLGSRTAGHPEYGHAAGIETTTGPLGQGLANAVGMALAERMRNARFGDDLVDHHTYVFVGDGCLMEGISHEAISMAGYLGLGKLIVLWDDNRISIDGDTALTVKDDQLARFSACGWETSAVDGHDPDAIAKAIEAAKKANRPSLIACRTVIGYGAPSKAGTAATHGAPLGEQEIAGAREELGWPYQPFSVPNDIVACWRTAGLRGASARTAWQQRLEAQDADNRATFERTEAGELPAGWQSVLDAHIKRVIAEKPKWATRQASGEALEVLCLAIPEMIGGSADLTGSNNTRTSASTPVGPDAFGGDYIHYGVREHGMAAAMNGIALHGGFIPFSGTFLVFSDYMRPSIRLAALMGQRVIHVLTHDSIGLGEDGPTHQPVESLAALRAIPGLHVFRPADAVETAECWALALTRRDGPSAMALTRQGVPTLRDEAAENSSARGAYVLAEADGGARQVTLLATGSEVSMAMAARDDLQAGGVPTAVVSMPCWELFDAQDAAYRQQVLGPGTIRVAVEAAVDFGWHRYLGENGAFVGMKGFGASAPANELYEHFGITAQAVAAAARKGLGV
ncbi:MAG: transketolase [Proteobacteria bacterium]|nr:transketolase [Pseudomonadota bacterium]